MKILYKNNIVTAIICEYQIFISLSKLVSSFDFNVYDIRKF